MHICRKRIRYHPDPLLNLEGQRLKMSNTHKILGLTFDRSMTWKAHIDEVRIKTLKRLNVLKSLAGMKWGADQGMLLRVHEMLILSALEYGSAAYGSARETQLRRLEPMHSKGLRIAIEAFCVCKTDNILCESGFENLVERRRRKIINTAIHVAENENHPVNKLFKKK
jgi:hypothetical protein